MESFLISLFYLARPMMSTQVDITVGGLNFFEALTLLFTIVLVVIAIGAGFRGSVKIPLSVTERWMLAFIVWATVTSLFYYNIADFKTYVKWVLPLITFMILKRGIHSEVQYRNLVGLMIVGFSVPVVLSVVLIAKGLQLSKVVYATGVERFHGAYATIHDMGHSMTLLFVSMTIFILVSNTVSAKRTKTLTTTRNLFFVFMGLMAFYCLYKAQVRTAYLGIFIFIVVFLYQYSKKMLLLFTGLFIGSLIVFGAIYYAVFFDVVSAVRGEKNIGTAGSGRIEMWENNWEIYSSLPIHRKFMGVGIGNKYGTATWKDPDIRGHVVDSHNDWFQVFIATGPVGFILMVGIYASLYSSILRIPGRERCAYVALFVSVVAMNAVSNSYFTRFALSQMFYMLMVYVEFAQYRRKVNVAGYKATIPERVIYKRIE